MVEEVAVKRCEICKSQLQLQFGVKLVVNPLIAIRNFS